MVIVTGQTRVRLPVTSTGRVARFDLGMIPDGTIPNEGVIRNLDVRCVGVMAPTGLEGWAIVSWLREE